MYETQSQRYKSNIHFPKQDTNQQYAKKMNLQVIKRNLNYPLKSLFLC